MLDADYYSILEISPNAMPEQIRQAFRRLALKYHPDVTTMKGSGRIKGLRDTYGFIGRADHPLDLYLNRHFVDEIVDAELNYGSQVVFNIRLSLHGPVATSVGLMSP